MKKSDIDNFEYYLDTYLKIFKKFKNLKNKNQTLKSSAILNETKMNNRELLNLTSFDNLNNSTISKEKNFTFKNKTNHIIAKMNSNAIANFTTTNTTFKKPSKLNSTISHFNFTNSEKKNITLRTDSNSTSNTKSNANSTIISLKENINVKKMKKQKLKQNVSERAEVNNSLQINTININQEKKINLTEKINSFLLGDSSPASNNTFTTLEDQINFSIKISKRKNRTMKQKKIEFHNNTSQKFENNSILKNSNKNISIGNFFKHDKFRILNQNTASSLKSKTNNTSVTNNKSNSISSSSNYYFDEKILENKIYKKLINISISLIVIGLLMGIFVGLIVVMYTSSNSK